MFCWDQMPLTMYEQIVCIKHEALHLLIYWLHQRDTDNNTTPNVKMILNILPLYANRLITKRSGYIVECLIMSPPRACIKRQSTMVNYARFLYNVNVVA